ncbi:hypothetical protein LOK49_LG02G00881 [Camellia lanceoleosa]|uniref:Uncharacterized protein n=1 Tax=Camellia lanceoleosa TaxID=1840588 RepID=A0ACC0IW99_9ERIC|nr:hypothetical protein LOK49_LG02G00881 [Camellia lanceoleosa]
MRKQIELVQTRTPIKRMKIVPEIEATEIDLCDIQDDLGHSLCADINSQETVSFVHCDITNESDNQNVADTAIAKHGKLDIMFNNASISDKIGPRIVAADCEDFKRVFDVNFFGAFLGANTLLGL